MSLEDLSGTAPGNKEWENHVAAASRGNEQDSPSSCQQRGVCPYVTSNSISLIHTENHTNHRYPRNAQCCERDPCGTEAAMSDMEERHEQKVNNDEHTKHYHERASHELFETTFYDNALFPQLLQLFL
jgi:hypothetical protein